MCNNKKLKTLKVKHRTSIAEVTGSNPVEALIFFRLLLSSCLNWKIHCEDHSSLSSITAVQTYELFHIYLHHNILNRPSRDLIWRHRRCSQIVRLLFVWSDPTRHCHRDAICRLVCHRDRVSFLFIFLFILASSLK